MRNNILILKKYLKEIKSFRSVDDLDNFLLSQSSLDELDSNILKGALWENFCDHLCDKASNITGISEIRPATPDEDYFKGTDGFGVTTYARPGMTNGEDAILQCKWKNPYAKNEYGGPIMLSYETIARAQKLINDGVIKPGRLCIMTNLSSKMITQEVKDSFKWIICRDNFETTLKNNQIFWKSFADKIERDYNSYKRNAKNIINREKDDNQRYPFLDFQIEQIEHCLKHQHTFNKLPPRSGKTKIQGGVIKAWLMDQSTGLKTIVYMSEGLDLLDQNFSKIALYLKSEDLDFKIITINSRRTWLFQSWTEAEEVGTDLSKDSMRDALLAPTNKLICITPNSYPNFLNFAISNDIKFYRITDEASGICPQKAFIKNNEDLDVTKKIWHSFSNMDPIIASANFDAFDVLSGRPGGPGTDNESVFGVKKEKTFSEMIERGTIVPFQLRPMVLYPENIVGNQKFYDSDWGDDDKINFTFLIAAVEDMMQDPSIPEAKVIAFLHNADICPRFKSPLEKYFQDKIDTIESLIAQTEDRPSLWKRYKSAKRAILLNYLIATKGIDDSTTYGVMLGRGMVSLRGAHAIQRGTTSHPEEYGLAPDKHKKKPFGVGYIPVILGQPDHDNRLGDLRQMLRLLYSMGWNENIKIVEVPKPKKKGRDDEADLPNDHKDIAMFDKFFEVEKDIKDAIRIEKETYGDEKFAEAIARMKKNTFDQILNEEQYIDA